MLMTEQQQEELLPPRLRYSGPPLLRSQVTSRGRNLYNGDWDDAASESALDSPHLLRTAEEESEPRPQRWGPSEVPDLLECLPGSYLGAGSTAKVHMSICRKSLDRHLQNGKFGQGWFRVYTPIAEGEKVAVKFHAYGFDMIGSASAGPSPTNYPAKFTTGVRERLVGARLAQGGRYKEHCCALLASWLDDRGIWLVYRLVPQATTLHQVLAPGSEWRSIFCSRKVSVMAELFRQCAKALLHLAEWGLVHRDGGLENWLVSNPASSSPQMVLIDFGLAVVSKEMYTQPDSLQTLLEHLHQSETGEHPSLHDLMTACPNMQTIDAKAVQRVSPIDWCYSPGAAGPKFPPPPELRVVKEELPLSRLAELQQLRQQGVEIYHPGYDVWILGWTFVQVILAERWCDWRLDPGLSTCTGENAKVQQLVRAMFSDRRLLVPTSWELGAIPPAWRLGVVDAGEEAFQQRFLCSFFQCVEERMQTSTCTPLQRAFLCPSGALRKMLGAMLDFNARHRHSYLVSGNLLQDLQELEEFRE
mmetsp:Transcript_15548/g.35609  ORF Transcript_15548/g.35609 Transcript_15548/m.35609 type:complete len:530 (+) Transcript_15548:182-1771(+)